MPRGQFGDLRPVTPSASDIWRPACPVGCLERVHDIVDDLEYALLATLNLLELLEGFLVVASRVVRLLAELPLFLKVLAVLPGKTIITLLNFLIPLLVGLPIYLHGTLGLRMNLLLLAG